MYASNDNERVGAGQVLFVIDDSDFSAKVAQATAAVASEEAMVATYATRHDFQEAMINQAAATVERRQGRGRLAPISTRSATSSLVGSDVATRQRFETAEADARKASAALLKAQAALEAEKQQLAVLEAQKARGGGQAAAGPRDAAACPKRSRQHGDPRAGGRRRRANRAGQTGQYVKPGTQLLSLVPLPKVYITANFKETQLTLMRPGQPVEISVDAYPDQDDRRARRELAPGSGAEFLHAAARQRYRQFYQDRPARARCASRCRPMVRSPRCCVPA